MAHSYTPGLKVTNSYLVRKRRILPLKGEVLAHLGDQVSPDDVVAQTFLPGKVHPVNVANVLGVDPPDVPLCMLKKAGEAVKKGEIIAESKSFFGLFRSVAKSPTDGLLESVSPVTGQVMTREDPLPVEVKAYLRGKIVEVIPEEGVVVEAYGGFIQGIFGIGGETFGTLKVVCDSPKQRLTADLIGPECKGMIILGGNRVTSDALKKAIDEGVLGVITGGFDDKDLRDFLGYDLGVAITGSEKLGITLVITEGFGDIDMAPQTYNLLKQNVGKEVSLNGATQIRAGVIRPEVVIPRIKEAQVEVQNADEVGGLTPGTQLRIIRQPYFGMLGKVVSLPPEPVELDSGSRARVLMAALENGEQVIVPRANVERIED